MVDTDGSDDEVVYTCKGCGSHEFHVEWLERTTTYYTDTLSCECGGVSDGIAAVRSYHIDREYATTRLLDEFHQWDEVLDIDPPFRPEEGIVEEDEYEVYCSKCEERAKAGDWEVEEGNRKRGTLSAGSFVPTVTEKLSLGGRTPEGRAASGPLSLLTSTLGCPGQNPGIGMHGLRGAGLDQEPTKGSYGAARGSQEGRRANPGSRPPATYP